MTIRHLKILSALSASLTAAVLLAPPSAADEPEKVVEVRKSTHMIVLASEGQGEPIVLDLENLEEGETRQIESGAGKEVRVTLQGGEYLVQVDGKEIRIPRKGRGDGAELGEIPPVREITIDSIDGEETGDVRRQVKVIALPGEGEEHRVEVVKIGGGDEAGAKKQTIKVIRLGESADSTALVENLPDLECEDGTDACIEEALEELRRQGVEIPEGKVIVKTLRAEKKETSED